MSRFALIRAVILAIVAALLSACSGASSGKPTIAAGFYPLAWVAEQIAGDTYDVVNLTSPGGEPHDLELTTAETASIANADLVVYESGFQPAVDDAVSTVADGATLDVAEVIALHPAGDHLEEDGHEGDGHDHGEFDPHFWLDPLLLADFADAMAKQLGDLNPDQADAFTQRAASLRETLTGIDQDFTQGLANCERDTIVVSHEAFGYWERYGLHIEAINGLSPDAEPLPADIAALQRLVRSDGITTIFSEELASAKMADTLAQDTGVTTAVLNPIEGLSDRTASDNYVSLMAANLTALQKANACA